MVVLDQDGVIQAEAVVGPAAAAHGVFLQRAQAWRGLSGADDSAPWSPRPRGHRRGSGWRPRIAGRGSSAPPARPRAGRGPRPRPGPAPPPAATSPPSATTVSNRAPRVQGRDRQPGAVEARHPALGAGGEHRRQPLARRQAGRGGDVAGAAEVLGQGGAHAGSISRSGRGAIIRRRSGGPRAELGERQKVRRGVGGQQREVAAVMAAAALLARPARRRRPGARRPAAEPRRGFPPGRRSARSAALRPLASRTTPAWRLIAWRRVCSAVVRQVRRGRGGQGAVVGSASPAAARPARVAEHRRLEQRVRGQAVGPVHPGRGAFAGREQARPGWCGRRRRWRSRPCGSGRPGRPGSAGGADRRRRPCRRRTPPGTLRGSARRPRRGRRGRRRGPRRSGCGWPRATMSRGARSPSGCWRAMNGAPSASTRHARLRRAGPRWPGARGRRRRRWRWGGTGRIPDRRSAPRPGPPAPGPSPRTARGLVVTA